MPYGTLTEVTILNRGTQATADVLSGVSVVPVENITQFDPDGGVLDICGLRYEYASINETTSEITLSTPLTVNVDSFDPVLVVAGGEIAQSYLGVVDVGDGDPARVEIPMTLRAQVPEGLYAEPVPVEVSADLTQLIDLPGRAPVLDGSYLDPTTIPDQEPAEAPTQSPAIEAHGMPSSVLLRATDTLAATSVIEYHVSLVPFTPVAGDPATLVATTRSLVQIVTELPNGTPLAELPFQPPTPTPFYFATIARNTLGTAPASATVTATLDPTAISEVIAEEVIAGFVLAGLIQVGSSITIDPINGLQIELTNNGLIALPADGSAALFRNVDIVADSLLVNNNFELRGILNRIAGALSLAVGVSTPLNAPTVGQGWDGPGIQVTAIAVSSAYCGLASSGIDWATVDRGGALAGAVVGIAKSGGAVSTLVPAVAGMTIWDLAQHSSGDFYVLYRITATGVNVIRKYNSAWVYSGTQFNTPTNGVANGTPCYGIAIDGSTLYYTYLDNSDSKTIVRSTTLTGTGTATVFKTADTVPNGSTISVGTADFGATRFLFSGLEAGKWKIAAYNSSGARQTANDFFPALQTGNSPSGIYWDGAQFWTLQSRTITKHSTLTATTARNVKYSQYDSVGTTHETGMSPGYAYSQPARSWMKVSTPAPDGSGGVDEPNRLRHYIQTVSVNASWWRQSDVSSPWAAYYGASVATSGNSAVSSPDFSGVANPGALRSEASDAYGPLNDLRGNGFARVHDIVIPFFEATSPQVQAAANTTVPNNADTALRWTSTLVADAVGIITNPNTVLNADGRIVLGDDGIYEILAKITHGNYSTTGRLYKLKILLNGATELDVDDQFRKMDTGSSTGGVPVVCQIRHRFAAADYIQVMAFQDSGAGLSMFSSGLAYARLQIARIGK